MAANKNRSANKIIEEKNLDIDFKAITFTTFGGFGEGTRELIKEVTKDTDWSLNDPWVKPSPKSHAYRPLVLRWHVHWGLRLMLA